MEKRLLNILRCPITHKGLSLAPRETLGRLNAAIDDGRINNHDGTALDEHLADALVTDDEKLVYPVVGGIPVLLEGESIRMDQLE